MKKSAFLSACLVAIGLSGWLSTAHADSAEAFCEVRKDGEVKQGWSGPCTFCSGRATSTGISATA